MCTYEGQDQGAAGGVEGAGGPVPRPPSASSSSVPLVSLRFSTAHRDKSPEWNVIAKVEPLST